ncbi:S41 family peptidase [Sulfuriflexus sp.]|uniref:S41 family peptidase n=1 Tax=Sulfuriflexus sp. TaxID=2015443 RepID=UPI0028CD205C|nr:S41 family peptidase [Sulfuriflexus sp.]MDT8404427.1 S41 family peptidase [Sulfuriflexus sp.]
MNALIRNFLVLTVGLMLGVSLAIGRSGLAERNVGNGPLPLDDLRVFTEVFEKIKNDYVEDRSDKELIESAISGMLSNLDPHSAYLNEDAFKELQVGTTGRFGGLGIEISMEDGFVKVVTPIDDTPAQRAGMQPGDLIIRLDDQSVKGMSLTEAVKIMRGDVGTSIELTVVREGAEKPLTFNITRDIIRVKSVKFRTLEDGFGYVRISQFQSHTVDNLADAISSLKDENENLKGIVLDLRNNPGGVLNAAVGVSDAFIDKGMIVYTEGRTGDSDTKFYASNGDLMQGAPIVVLINGGSASASEIVAGALQDHQRAVIMGTESFGKGSVQTILPMNNGTAVKLTTARYFTPNGRSIQAEGIVPDIKTERLRVSNADESVLKGIKEADLSGHLSNGNGKKEKTKKGKDSKKADKAEKEEKKSLVSEDYQLYEALNLLKGMNIMHTRLGR